MNELEHQLVDRTLESIHSLDKNIIELKGDIKSLREHFDDQYNALSEKLDRSIETAVSYTHLTLPTIYSV